VRRQELEDRLRTAREAAAEVLACKALRDVLGLGLTVGNFLNEGHMLGNALGFPPKAAPQHACAAAAEGG